MRRCTSFLRNCLTGNLSEIEYRRTRRQPGLGCCSRRLKAVLRARDFAEFDLDRAFATVAEVAAAVARTP